MALTHLTAPAQWQTIDFVSDLHLQQTDATWHSFEQYLHSTPADAIFLLGDILELWAGDDALQHPELAFERQLAATLQTVSRNKSLYFMRGNRDFLVGNAFCQAAGLTLLDDPCTLEIPCADATAAPTRILLSHGDALCLDDTATCNFAPKCATLLGNNNFYNSHWSNACNSRANCASKAACAKQHWA